MGTVIKFEGGFYEVSAEHNGSKWKYTAHDLDLLEPATAVRARMMTTVRMRPF